MLLRPPGERVLEWQAELGAHVHAVEIATDRSPAVGQPFDRRRHRAATPQLGRHLLERGGQLRGEASLTA